MSFKDKVVIVTGASSGIGAATAVEFAKQQADVVIVARNKDKMEQVAAECALHGKKPLLISADLVNVVDVNRVVAETLAKFGKIDVLVNNAGAGHKVSFDDTDAVEIFDKLISVNLRSVVRLTHLVTPHLVKTKGNVVNVSSVAGIKNIASYWAYCTAKAGLDHFSRCIAAHLAPQGVRVNTVNPGPVRTNFVENMGVQNADAIYDLMANSVPLKRNSDPIEIADVILYLASEKAKGVTGSNWVTDNGHLVS